MTTLADIRRKHAGAYDDLDDNQLANALYRKYYSDMPREQFNQKVGLVDQAKPQAEPARPTRLSRIGNAIGGAVGGAAQGLSFGFGDEAEAALASLVPADRMVRLDGKADIRFGDYKGNLAQIRKRNAEQRAAAPKANLAGELSGGVGAGGRKLMQMGAVKGGAIAGGLFGAGSAEGGALDRLVEGGKGAGLGAVGGAALSKAGGSLAALARTRAADKLKDAAMPTLDAMKQGASDLYKRVDDLGVRYSPDQMQALFQSIKDQVPTEGLGAISAGTHPTANAAVRQMQRVGPQDTSLLELDRFRRLAGGASPTNPADGRMAGLIRDEVDDFTAGITPAVRGKEAAGLLQQARGAHGQFRRAEQVDEALGAAALSAESNRVPDVMFSQRKAIKNILNSPTKRRGYSPEQIEAMKNFVRMTPTQKFTDFMAKSGRGQMGVALGGGAGLAMGGPVGAVAVPALGYAARKVGDKSSERARDAMVRALRTQGMPDAVDSRLSRLVEDQRIQSLLNRLSIVSAN